MRYALWNNKGGVGKTFLSFVLATEYARNNPDSHVVVMDMCPQANVSEIFLGGNGKGSEILATLIEKRQTVGGYFDDRILRPHESTGTESSKLIRVSEYNNNIPDNISLIAGDPSLELQVQTINNLAVVGLPEDAWKNVHSWIVNIQDAARVMHKERQVVFFIDCNPSFSSYTEQAIIAADRLIAPCSPDGSSARAIRNVCRLVYGHETPAAYQKASFANKVKEFGMSLPKLYLTVLNRSTQYDKRPSKAFKAMLDQIKKEVQKVHEKHAHAYFDGRKFEDLFSDMPDAHTVAVVCSSKGMPLFKIQPGQHTLSNGELTTVNSGPLDRYKKEIAKIVAGL